MGNKDRIKNYQELQRTDLGGNLVKEWKNYAGLTHLNAPRKENYLQVNPIGRIRREGRKLTAKFN